MNLRMRLALIALGSVCAAFVATEWLSYPRETWIRWIASFGIWSGVALVFAGAVDRAVTLPLQRLQLFALRLGKEPDPPKPQFRDTEWSELADAVASASRAKIDRPVPSAVAMRNVRLAREYVEGITLLLDVSRQHNTPLPTAATKNLVHMSSLLKEAETALCGRITECRASPSDRSKPFG
jgi:hypothetical protein